MKRVLLASVSLAALMTGRSVFAADLAARLPTKAPAIAPAPYFSWTGCYVGGTLGGGWGIAELTGASNDYLLSDFGLPSLSNNISGFIGGGQIGCNYQFAKNWVIGLEGDISAADIEGKSTAGDFLGDPLTFSARTNWIGSVAGRLGYASDRWLVYVKGGPAWADDKYQLTSNTYLGTYDASEWRSGWTLGGGLEWAFADNWSAKLEYDYYDFGNRVLQFDSEAGYTPSGESVKQQIQVLKVGVDYHFWSGGMPSTANY
jgi:outer membrane immunogenic protein